MSDFRNQRAPKATLELYHRFIQMRNQIIKTENNDHVLSYLKKYVSVFERERPRDRERKGGFSLWSFTPQMVASQVKASCPEFPSILPYVHKRHLSRRTIKSFPGLLAGSCSRSLEAGT